VPLNLACTRVSECIASIGGRRCKRHTVADLADGNWNLSRDDLRLPILENRHESSLDHLRADDLASRCLGRILNIATGRDLQVDGRAMLGPRSVVQVGEASRCALVKDCGSSEAERPVLADAEARVDKTSMLRRRVKLELVVASNVSSSTSGVGQNAILERNHELRAGTTGGALL
jgi:hypothetical protein